VINAKVWVALMLASVRDASKEDNSGTRQVTLTLLRVQIDHEGTWTSLGVGERETLLRVSGGGERKGATFTCQINRGHEHGYQYVPYKLELE
jgi:hypothetical protein